MFLGNLKRKARIAIPAKYGRNLMGVMDETRTLEYGQVYIQYSEQVGHVVSETKILRGILLYKKRLC